MNIAKVFEGSLIGFLQLLFRPPVWLLRLLFRSPIGLLRLLFRSSISFWSDPKADGVAYLITSGFGLLIVSLARNANLNLKQTAWSHLLAAGLPLLLVIFIVLGICVVLDRGLRESISPITMVVNATRTVLVCNLISCFFVLVIGFFSVFNLIIAHLLGFVVISLNTVTKRSVSDFNQARILIWGLILFVFAGISFGILVS